jgi:Na+/H+ antiporter NhaD/arsenite permease-like protein
MEALEILIPLTFFAMIAAIVIGPRYLKSLERRKMADTLRAAIDKGQPLPPEVINLLTADARPPASPQRDLRRGVILVAVALGLVVMGLVVGQGEPDATYPMIGVAAIPGFLGLALIAIARLGKDRT